LKKPSLFANCAADAVKEGMILSTLSHPNVLAVRAWSPNGVDSYSNGRNDSFFLVLDKLEETLQDKLRVWRAKYDNIWNKQRFLQKSLLDSICTVLTK
jgi:hypothetical protein